MNRVPITLIAVTGIFVALCGVAPAGQTCFGDAATDSKLVGTTGSDELIGTSGPDVIIARGGNDRIEGRGGDDKICGGDGNDTISGGNGFDQIDSGPGSDRSVSGNEGDDTIRGLSGEDHLMGNAGDDKLAGGEGDDLLSGGVGYDYIRFDLAPSPGVVVDLKSRRVSGSHGNDTLVDIHGLVDVEGVYGSAFADRVSGSGVSNTFILGDGDDVVEATVGEDLINGGSGEDRIDYSSFSVEGGITADLDTNRVWWSGESQQILAFIEHVIGSPRGDVIRGGRGTNRLVGGRGNDEILGRGGNDQLLGSAGDDYLSGGKGRDTCRRGSGDDAIRNCER